MPWPPGGKGKPLSPVLLNADLQSPAQDEGDGGKNDRHRKGKWVHGFRSQKNGRRQFLLSFETGHQPLFNCLLQPNILDRLFTTPAHLGVVLFQACRQTPLAGLNIGAVLFEIAPALVGHIG
jgi:hypothetical protein